MKQQPGNTPAVPPEESKPIGFIRGISRDLGLGEEFIADAGKEIIVGIVKEKLGLSVKKEVNKSKVGRTIESLKGLWWVPAAVYVTVMVAVLLIKFMSKELGV